MTHQEALIANRVQRECLLSCDGDIDAALAAADAILSMKPFDYERWGIDPTDSPNLWVEVPDLFLSVTSPNVMLATPPSAPARVPDIIVHNHIAAPEITVNVPKMEPIINVRTPEQTPPTVNITPTIVPAPVVNVSPANVTVNVPEQNTPVINVAAPIVTVESPTVALMNNTAEREISLKKDGSGSWTGKVKG